MGADQLHPVTEGAPIRAPPLALTPSVPPSHGAI
jgi:hypothetical protein